jgi:hypothetical protein
MSIPSSSQRRKLVRRELYFYLLVTDRDTGAELGRIIDIHEAGLLLVGDEPKQPGQSYNLAIHLPKNFAPSTTDNTVFLRGQVMWTRRDQRTRFMEAGVKFGDSTQEEKETIANLIEWCGMPSKPLDDADTAEDEV